MFRMQAEGIDTTGGNKRKLNKHISGWTLRDSIFSSDGIILNGWDRLVIRSEKLFVICAHLLVVAILGICIGIANVIFHIIQLQIWESWFFRLGGYFTSTIGWWYLYVHMSIGVAVSGLFVGFLTSRYFPECSGGGSIAVKMCMAVGTRVPLHIGVLRVIITSIYSGLGNPLGNEAPTLHVCSAVACTVSGVAQGLFPTIFPVAKNAVKDGGAPPLQSRTRRRGGGRDTAQLEESDIARIPSDSEAKSTATKARRIRTAQGLGMTYRMYVMIGCTSGMSAAFNVPLGGLLFAMEEFVDLRTNSLASCFLAMSCVCATVVTRFIYESMGFNGLLFDMNVTTVVSELEPTLWLWLWSIVLGILCGLLGALFADLTLWIRQAHKIKKYKKNIKIFICAFTKHINFHQN